MRALDCPYGQFFGQLQRRPRRELDDSSSPKRLKSRPNCSDAAKIDERQTSPFRQHKPHVSDGRLVRRDLCKKKADLARKFPDESGLMFRILEFES